MKKLITLFVCFMTGFVSQVAAMELIIEMNSGEIHSFELSGNPEIQFQDDNLIVSVNDKINTFKIDDVKRLSYGKYSSVEENHLDAANFYCSDGVLTIAHPAQNIIISDMTGKIICSYAECQDNTYVTIDLKRYVGTYVIVRNGSHMIKLYVTK